MPCINVREGNARLIVYALDGCGNPTDGDADGKLMIDRISEFSYEDSITEGDESTERNFGGAKKYSAVGADEIDNIDVQLTALGIIPALDVMLMGATAKTDSGGDVVGFGRTNLSSSTAVAVEVLLELDSDACAEGSSAAPVAGWFFPFVKNWKPNGGTTLNGTDLVKPPYSGKGYKNANIFSETLTDADFVKWETDPGGGDQPHVPQTSSTSDDGEWYSFFLFDGDTYSLPALPADCGEPQELT